MKAKEWKAMVSGARRLTDREYETMKSGELVMSEAGWLRCTDPAVLLRYVWAKASKRKLQLYYCGGCSRQTHLYYRDNSFELLAFAERCAEGLFTEDELRSAEYSAEAWTFGCDFDEEFCKEHPERMSDTVPKLVELGVFPSSVLHGGEWIVNREIELRIHDAAEMLYHTVGIPWDTYLHPFTARRLSKPEWPGRWLIDCIFGNPFRPVVADPAWLTPTVRSIAEAIYRDRAFDRLPILADALEEAGCTNADVLLHCRQPGEHVRGCWVVDSALGKG